jgi:tetratricopeptide (TPR) repeat protein
MAALLLILVFILHPNLALQQTFVIIGGVRDPSGQAVANVRVSVSDENMMPIRTIIVDSSGHFRAPGLRVGTYMIRIETTGTPYEEQTHRIELQSGGRRGRGGEEPYPLEFTLKFKKGREDIKRTDSVFAQTAPAAARSEYERGVKSLKANKTEQAFSSLKKAVELFPDYYEALETLGIEYVKSSQYEAALPLLSHALEINKRGAKSSYGLGVAYLNLNRLAEAIERLEASAQLDPNNPNPQMMLGLAYGNSRFFDKSESAFIKALQLADVGAAEAHFYLAGLYNKQGKYQQARRELELYLKRSKNLKDPAQIKAMIEKLKEKEKGRGAQEQLPIDPNPATPASQPAPVESTAATDNAADATKPSSTGAQTESHETESRHEPEIPKPEPVPPLPDEFAALISQSAVVGGTMHKQLLDYTYTLKKIRRVLDERGNPGASEEQVFEAYPVRGEHILIRLSTDGVSSRSLAEDRKQAVRQLEDAESRRGDEILSGKDNAGEPDGYISAGISGVYNGKVGQVSINISAFLQNCEFFDPRIEDVSQRPTAVLSFRPRAGVAVSNGLSYVTKLVGKIWIDKTDRVVTRVEAWPMSAFDLISSTATNNEAALIYLQERQPDGLWFPALIRANARGRKDLFNGLNWDVLFEFSNYQRFNTTSSEKINVPQTKSP